jgi:hypothetical protein
MSIIREYAWKAALAAAVVCLVKIAFFSPAADSFSLVGKAQASSLLELNGPARIVSTSEDGATAYVWDFENKTQVRKYVIKGDHLVLTEYKIEDR